MPRFILLAISILFAAFSFAQTEVSFQPKWKVGDKRTATIVTQEREYKKGELTEDNTETTELTYEVMKETTTDYTVKVTMQNVALVAVVEVYDKIGDDLPKYKNLELLYQVNKIGGTADLLNWKEAQAFVVESFEQIEKVMKKKMPDDVGFAKMMMKPITNMFNSKESVEGYMKTEIEYLLTPYSKAFVLNDTLKVVEIEANPLNPSEEISATHSYYLTDKGKGIYNLNYGVEFDMSGFVAMIKGMMEEMGKSFGVEDSSIAKKNAELDDISIDMDNNSDWLYDSNTGWLTKVTTKTEFYGSDPKGERRNIKESVITFK